MVEPPEPLEAGELFRIYSETYPVSGAQQLETIPSGEFVSLVATAPRFALLFLANSGNTFVYRTTSLTQSSVDSALLNQVWCGGRITHITRTCDCCTIVVSSIWSDNVPQLLFFDVHAFLQKETAAPYMHCSASNIPGSRLTALVPSPTDPGCVALCTSSGDLTILTLFERKISFNTKRGIFARSVCWSAKGKQLCVGCSTGELALFKPDLTPVRQINPPSFSVPSSVAGVVWFTNTEFFVCYQQANSPTLVYVNAPKDKPSSFLVFEDICYSSADQPSPYYHMCYVPEWQQLFVLSSGGVELATVVKLESGWTQLVFDEGFSGEMRCVHVTEETYPLGIAIDFSSSKIFPVQDGQSEGPFPALYSLSTGNEINIFYARNTLPDKPNLCQKHIVDKLPVAEYIIKTAEQYGKIIVIPRKPADACSKSPGNVTFDGAKSALQTATSDNKQNVFDRGFFGGSCVAPSSTTSSLDALSPFSDGAPATKVSSALGSNTSGSGASVFGTSGGSVFGSGGSVFGGRAGTVFNGSAGAAFGVSSGTAGSLFGGTFLSGSSSNGLAPSSTTNFNAQQTAITTSFAAKPKTSSSVLFGSSAVETPSVATATTASSQPTTLSLIATTSVTSDPQSTYDFITAKNSIPVAVPTTPQASTALANSSPSPAAVIVPATVIAKNSPLGNASPQGCLVQTDQSISSSIDVRTPQQKTLILAQIDTELKHFENELHDHFAINQQCEYKGGWEETLEEALSVLAASDISAKELRSSGQDISDQVSELHTQLIEFYSGYEEGKMTVARSKDPSHALLSEWKSLDRCSDRRLQELRAKLHYIQSEMTYANATLDSLASARLSKQQSARDRKRGIHTSNKGDTNCEAVYRTVMLAHNARRACERQLDGLSEKVTALSLCTAATAASLGSAYAGDVLKSVRENVGGRDQPRIKYGISDESLLVNASASDKENLSNISGSALTPAKQEKLWNILQHRKSTPVRKSDRPLFSPTVSATPNASKAKSISGYNSDALLSSLRAQQLHNPPPTSLNKALKSSSSETSTLPSPVVTDSFLRSTQNLDRSMFLNFGFNTCSTPTTDACSIVSAATSSHGLQVTPVKSEVVVAVTDAVKSSGFAFSVVPSTLTTSVKVEPVDSISSSSRPVTFVSKYEDITPPGTPDIPPLDAVAEDATAGVKPLHSPLTALSSLVGKVPTVVTTTPSLFCASPLASPSPVIPSFTPAAVGSTLAVADAGSAPTKQLTGVSTVISVHNTPAGQNKVFGFGTSAAQGKQSAFSFLTTAATQEGTSLPTTPAPNISSNVTSSSGTAFTFGGSAFSKEIASVSTASSFSFASGAPSLASTSTAALTKSSFTFCFGGSSTAGTLGSAFGSSTSTAPLFVGMLTTSKPTFDNATSLGNSALFAANKDSFVATVSSVPTITLSNAAKLTTVTATTPSTPVKSMQSSSITSVPSVMQMLSQNTYVTVTPITAASITSSETPANGTICWTSATETSRAAETSIANLTSAATLSSAVTFSSTLTKTAFDFGSGPPFTSSGSLFVPAVSASIFNSATSASSSSLSKVVSPFTKSGSLFGASTSAFSSSSVSETVDATSKGASVAASSVESALFGNSTSSSSSAFGVVSTTASSPDSGGASTASAETVIGTSSTSSLFSAPTTASLIFVAPVSTATSVFAVPRTSSTSVLGTLATSALVFGTPATSTSIFGASVSKSSVFGIPAISSNSVFGAPTTSSSVFGVSTTSTSVFGAPTSSSSVFGTPTTSPLVFGAPAISSSVFGTPTTSTSLFGTPVTSTSAFGISTTSSTSVFGMPATSSISVFGAPATTASMFSSSSTNPSVSVFGGGGGSSTFGTSSFSLFGGSQLSTTSSSSFASGGGSVFGSIAAPATSGSSGFGGTSSFGATSPFSATTSGSSVFGTPSSSVFGVATTSESLSVFGVPAVSSCSASVFGGTSSIFGGSSSGGSLFGSGSSMFTGLGNKPSSPVTKNVFGVTPGSSKPQTDIFGGSGANVAAPSVFGASAAATTPSTPASAFGAAPTFGSPPKFGGGPTFGSPPTFGSSGGSVFGGSSGLFGASSTGGESVFGSSSSSGGGIFGGASSSGGSTFGSFAPSSGSGFGSFVSNANTSSFGDLAANSDNRGGFGENTVFGKSGSGNSSFTAWR